MLEDAGMDIAGALELIAMDRPYRRIRSIAQKYYRNYATQSTHKIDDLFATIGIKKLCPHAEKRAKRTKLISSIDALVKRRHQIVHAGDLMQTGKMLKLDKRMLNRVDDVYAFVDKANLHIDHFMKQKPKK